MKMAQVLQRSLGLLLLCSSFQQLLGEYRKLIPVCSNSCLAAGTDRPTNCFCDSKCSLVYNDCCLDAPYRTVRVNMRQHNNLHCVFVHGENRHFWMVDTCKDSYSGHDHIKDKCGETNVVAGISNDIIGSIPVTNPNEGVTYKNYYCAICNEEDPDGLVEWQVKALCDNPEISEQDLLQNLTYVESRRQWGVYKLQVAGDWKFHECFLLFERPNNISNGVRHCLGGMVAGCPKTWKNIAIRRKCKSYVDPVKWSIGPVYKNIDCATCHNQTTENFQCVTDVVLATNAIMLKRAMTVDLSSMGQWF